MAAVANDLLTRLPVVRGAYRSHADLSATTWFRVGGKAEVLFKPADEEDLATFMAHRPFDVPVTVIGVGFILRVRQGTVSSVVIRLQPGFVQIVAEGLRGVPVLLGLARDDRQVDLGDLEARAAHHLDLLRVVGHQSDGFEAEGVQDLGAGAEIALVVLEA